MNTTELIVVENRQGKNFDVKIGRLFLEEGKYISIELIRSNSCVDGKHMPAKVSDMLGNTLWSFEGEKENGFIGRGWLVFFKKISEYVIYLENQDGIVKIILIMSLDKLRFVRLGGSLLNLGGRTIEEMAQLKKDLAKQLDKKAILTKEETDALEEAWLIGMANRKIAKEEDDLRKENERRKRKEEKESSVKVIMARPQIHAYTADGQILSGIPVVDSEWTILPSIRVILVKSYDAETQIPGEPIEAFFIKRNGYQREKSYVKSLIFSQKPKNEKVIPQALGKMIFKINGKFESVLHFSQEDAKILKEQGLSSGTIIAIGNPDAVGKYSVVSLHQDRDEFETVGAFVPVDLKQYISNS